MKRNFCILFSVLSIFIYTHGLGYANQTITLQDTLNFAFNYSPNIKAAQEARQQSVHNVRVAEAGYYPTIGIWGGAGIENTDSIGTRANNTEYLTVGNFNLGVQVSQVLWQGGNTSANVRMRNEELNYRAWILMDSANSLAYSAISAHADVVRRRVLVNLCKENVAENKRILNMLYARFDQGLSSVGDVEQVKGRLARAEATLSVHQQALEAAFTVYTKVTGQLTPKLLAPVPMPKRIFSSEDEAREVSANKSSRIQSDLASIRNAMAAKDVTNSRFSPRVTIDAGPNFSTKGYEGTQYQTTWSAMLNTQWNIFNGGADTAQLKADAARVRELRKRLHETMDLVNQELMITFSLTKRSAEQSKIYTFAAKSARKAKDNFITQFDMGQKDLLSILDAEGEYFFSATEREVRKTDTILGHYRLLAISGELLDECGINKASLMVDTTKGSDSSTYTPWNFAPTTLDTKEAMQGTNLLK